MSWQDQLVVFPLHPKQLGRPLGLLGQNPGWAGGCFYIAFSTSAHPPHKHTHIHTHGFGRNSKDHVYFSRQSRSSPPWGLWKAESHVDFISQGLVQSRTVCRPLWNFLCLLVSIAEAGSRCQGRALGCGDTKKKKKKKKTESLRK